MPKTLQGDELVPSVKQSPAECGIQLAEITTESARKVLQLQLVSML